MPRKRQFALWTLFATVFLAALTMTVVVRLIQIRAQEEVVRQVTSAGGNIFYQFPFRFIVALRFEGRSLSEKDVEAVGELTLVRRLTLSDCVVPAENLEWLVRLQRLRSLDLRDTQLNDQQIADIADIESLCVLELSQTGLSDQGLAHLSKLERLYSLSLKGNPITDESIPTLKQFSQLRFLDIRSTRITAAGLQQLQADLPDCKIKS